VFTVFAAALLSCGREPTAPSSESWRFARGLAFNAMFPPAYQQALAGASNIVPFDRVRVVFRQTNGTTALDTVVLFPSGTDSVALSLAVPLSPAVPASGEPLNLYLDYVNAQGDTVFRGGPVALVVLPDRSGQPAPAPVTVPVIYTGIGASARRAQITPKALAIHSGETFAFSASALDSNGVPIPGTPIVFRSLDLSMATILSPISGGGVAAIPRGLVAIVAQLLTGRADTAILTILPTAAALQLVVGGAPSGLVATQLSQAVIVRLVATDGFGILGALVTFVAAGGGSVGSGSATTDANGLAQTTWKFGPHAGTQQLVASAAGVASITVTAAAMVQGEGPASRLVFSSQPGNAVAGAAISPSIVVTAKDTANNTASTFNGTVALNLANAPAGASLGGTKVVSAVDGIATFSAVTLAMAGAGYSLVASSGSLLPDTSKRFTVSAGGVAHFVAVGGNNQSGPVDAPLPVPISVMVTDASGNPVRGVAVTWAASAGGGSVSPGDPHTDGFGVSSKMWTLGSTAGVQSIAAIADGLTGSSVTFTATATPGGTARLSFFVEPSHVVAGSAIKPPIQVRALDSDGNHTPQFAGAVTIAIVAGPAGATLGGTTTVNTNGGTAHFGDLTIDKAGAGYQLVASSAGLSAAVSSSFAVSSGTSASLLLVSGDQQHGTVGTQLSAPLVVQATDSLGNPAAGVSVTWVVTQGAGTLGSVSAVTNGAGLASNTWILGTAPGAQKVTAAAPGLAGSPIGFKATANP
jgi:hypothetical protein